jgi:hypothetical protein
LGVRRLGSYGALALALAGGLLAGGGCSGGGTDRGHGTGGDAGSGGSGGTAGRGGFGGTGNPLGGNGGDGFDGGDDEDGGGFEGDDPENLIPLLVDACGAGNAAMLDAAAVTALQTPGDASGMRWLYPYDGTIFPRGLMPPLMMWSGNDAPDAVYLHIKSGLFEYHGCLVPSGNGQLPMPDDIWAEMGERAMGEADPFVVSLNVRVDGVTYGPITESLVIARATLKGSIYYNTYSSEKFRQAGGSNGAVLRIPPGDWAEVFLELRNCHGCHTVSANGARLVALSSDNQGSGSGVSYELSQSAPPLPVLTNGSPGATFAGVTPDGELFLSNANIGGIGPQQSLGPVDATLYETDTGTEVPGTGIVTGALMPTFSSDGSLLVFNDYAINTAHGLALMDFDQAARTADNYRKIYESPTDYPAWPFVMPDDRAVLFALTNSPEFSGKGGYIAIPPLGPAALDGPPSDLYLLDLDDDVPVLLARAMGFDDAADATAGTTYLPFGLAAEAHQNYYPTVSPVPSGGYFWVFFDSIRHLGNLGRQRGLWATAVTLSAAGDYSVDPSHPAFYVPGQEYGAGNHRAFTALDPCMEDGADCSVGVDCCNGFCTDGSCGQPAPRCSKLDESCASTADCCDATQRCIGGYCSVILVE